MTRWKPTRKPGVTFAVSLLALWLFWLAFGVIHQSHKPGSIMNDIYNTTLGFEKIFVIGLPERTDRRDSITLQAALSNLDFEFIDGVYGDNVKNKAIPKTTEHERLGPGTVGCWRAHMDAVHQVVKRNLTSALILEDDVDWDVRIRQQLYNMALATQALIQPLAGRKYSFADETYQPQTHQAPPKRPVKEIPEFPINHLPKTVPATITPYGDRWDLIWVGYCGVNMPVADSPIPRGRVISLDESVPEKRYLWSLVPPFLLKDEYPDHTRIVHHVKDGACTLGYAITQRGARALLHEIALKDVDDPVYMLLRLYCEGGPSLFNHYRPEGPANSFSDIENHKGWQDHPLTDMTRWSVRLNVDNILDGREMWDQLPN
ncbi:unnamed protein product [Clonostachys rosea]|uniref:Glycosyl transferase family 25 domain-containing protein n=1 Tax=Bionectria ochroleuca TaxID=29856 RepID=A0ABY6UP10_BIOOC|nr:unnamed protein product [Clonostachys rosea]